MKSFLGMRTCETGYQRRTYKKYSCGGYRLMRMSEYAFGYIDESRSSDSEYKLV